MPKEVMVVDEGRQGTPASPRRGPSRQLAARSPQHAPLLTHSLVLCRSRRRRGFRLLLTCLDCVSSLPLTAMLTDRRYTDHRSLRRTR